jgi:hypothetical protein
MHPAKDPHSKIFQLWKKFEYKLETLDLIDGRLDGFAVRVSSQSATVEFSLRIVLLEFRDGEKAPLTKNQDLGKKLDFKSQTLDLVVRWGEKPTM